MNEPVALEMLDRQYDYRGLLDRDGFYDRSVFKDENEAAALPELRGRPRAARVSVRARGRDEAGARPDGGGGEDLRRISRACSTTSAGSTARRTTCPAARGSWRELIRREGRTPFLLRYQADIQAEAGRLLEGRGDLQGGDPPRSGPAGRLLESLPHPVGIGEEAGRTERAR